VLIDKKKSWYLSLEIALKSNSSAITEAFRILRHKIAATAFMTIDIMARMGMKITH
jgi:hypothetical protein